MAAAPELVWTGERGQGAAVVLAHGAGAPMDSPFMDAFAEGLAGRGLSVARFEFPYMAARRQGGPSRPPDRAAKLLETWRQVIGAVDAAGVSRRALVIGGKSMGGRMAAMIADEEGVLGVACLGFPFHPPGRPEATRVDCLNSLAAPALVVQGTRDRLGTREEVLGYGLPTRIRTHWIEDGDHSLKPRKSSGMSVAQAWQQGIAAVAAFVREVAEEPRAL